MKQFSNILQKLEHANDSELRTEILTLFWNDLGNDDEKDLILQLFAGQYPKKIASTQKLQSWIAEITGFQKWLIDRSLEETGNAMQTFNLLLRCKGGTLIEKTLNEWLDEIKSLKDDETMKVWLKNQLSCVEENQKLIILKLITGIFRSPLSRLELVKSIAAHAGLKFESVSLRLFESIKTHQISFSSLKDPLDNEKSMLPPLFPEVIKVQQYEVFEWQEGWQLIGNKDGLEVQVTKFGRTIHLWTRQGEVITNSFPEIISAFSNFNSDFKLFGKLALQNPDMPVEQIKSRINKKKITKVDFESTTITLDVIECLEGELDWNQKTESASVKSVKTLNCSSKDELLKIHNMCRELGYIGLYLKQGSKSVYFDWKAHQYSVNAVLCYVEFGGIENKGIKTLTFGVRKKDEFLPVAKVPASEYPFDLDEIIKYVKENTLERFGPVRTVAPRLTYKIHFDSLSRSTRRKSGLAMKNPKVNVKLSEQPETVHNIDYLFELLNKATKSHE